MSKSFRSPFFLAPMLAAVWLAAATTTAAAQSGVPVLSPDDRILGKADAPVTIFEYASLTCPHCAAFEADTYPQVKEAWINAGKAKLIFRNFPLDKLALSAATLAHCVPPERFYDVVEALFKDQNHWVQMQDANQALARVAEIGGLNKQQADTCLKDDKVIDFVVTERYNASKNYGVNATPTFFINGEKTVGERSYPDFDKLLQSAAAKP